jgi:hypothetical protein
MLNMSLVRVDSFSHMFAIGFLQTQLVLFFALVTGARRDIFMRQMSRLWENCQMSRIMRRRGTLMSVKPTILAHYRCTLPLVVT